MYHSFLHEIYPDFATWAWLWGRGGLCRTMTKKLRGVDAVGEVGRGVVNRRKVWPSAGRFGRGHRDVVVAGEVKWSWSKEESGVFPLSGTDSKAEGWLRVVEKAPLSDPGYEAEEGQRGKIHLLCRAITMKSRRYGCRRWSRVDLKWGTDKKGSRTRPVSFHLFNRCMIIWH